MRALAKAAGIAGLFALALMVGPGLRAGPVDGAGHAGPVREGEAVMTELAANASAMTSWVRGPDGWHVVTVVDTVSDPESNAEKHAVVRFSSVLLPGQSQLISVPAASSAQQIVLRIRRLDDRLEVARVPASAV